jgi:hypothetical protein
MSTFTAYYDLEKCPASYDVVSFLLHVERERLRRGEDRVEINIIPGPELGFRKDNLWPRSVDERRRLLHRVVVPMCRMLPGSSVTVYGERPPEEAGSIGYGEYSMPFKRFVAGYAQGIRPFRCPPLSAPQDYITITLREAEHHPQRNSRTEEWIKAARTMMDMGYSVVVVRDTTMADVSLAGITTSPTAAYSLDVRAALYGAAACNLFVSNGPAWFAMALDAPVLMLRPATEGIGTLYSAAGLERMGIPAGGQIPGAPVYQRLVWEEDTADAILLAFQGFMAARQKAA